MKEKETKIYNIFEHARLDLQAKMQAQNKAMKIQIREEYYKAMKIQIREEYFKTTIHIKTLELQLTRSFESKPKANLNGNQRNIFPEQVQVANFFFYCYSL